MSFLRSMICGRQRLSICRVAVLTWLLMGSLTWAVDPEVIWCQPLQHPNGPTIGVSPDGLIAASAAAQSDGSQASIKVWNAHTGELQREIPIPGYPNWVAISSKGYVAAGISSGLNLVVLYDVNTGDYVRTFFDVSSYPIGGAFSEDGTILAVGDFNLTARTYTIPEGHVIRHITMPDIVNIPDSITLSPDGQLLAIAGHNGIETTPYIDVYKIPSAQLAARLTWDGLSPALKEVKFSHDGTMLGVTATDGFLRIWDTGSWGLVHEFDSEFITGSWSAHEFDFSPDDRLVLWGLDPNPVATLIIRLDTGEVLADYFGGIQRNAEFLADGSGWIKGGVNMGLCLYKNEFLWVSSDLNSDSDVDISDFAIFSSCMTGPGGTLAFGCELADLDADNDVDMVDYSKFVNWFPW